MYQTQLINLGIDAKLAYCPLNTWSGIKSIGPNEADCLASLNKHPVNLIIIRNIYIPNPFPLSETETLITVKSIIFSSCQTNPKAAYNATENKI